MSDPTTKPGETPSQRKYQEYEDPHYHDEDADLPPARIPSSGPLAPRAGGKPGGGRLPGGITKSKRPTGSSLWALQRCYFHLSAPGDI